MTVQDPRITRSKNSDVPGRGPVDVPLCAVPYLVRTPISLLISEYTNYHEADFSAGTLEAKRRELDAFANWLGRNRNLATVTRQVAARYVANVLMANGRVDKTNQDSVGHLHGFWNYAIDRGLYAGRNPWARLASPFIEPAGAQGKFGRRRPWTGSEMQRVFLRHSRRHNVWIAGVLALYSGARLRELCSIRTADVDFDAQAMTIPDIQTGLVRRAVPIHPVLQEHVWNQCAGSPDGYLLHDEKCAGPDRVRSRNLSRRFTNWLRDDLEIDDRDIVFQSLRYTFMAAAESAGISERSIMALLGRKPPPTACEPAHADIEPGALARQLATLTHGKIDDLVAARARSLAA